VLLSGDDRALKLSSIISGSKPRVGDYGDAADLAIYGVIVADLTQAKGNDRLNHAKFADNPFMVQLLGERLSVPAGLRSEEIDAQPIDTLGRGIGQTVGSAAEIVVTTPFRVLKIVTGNSE
jgi:esterase/lipase superfamily enzyme